ncbi:hypothetical protein NF867_09870 [Solitalea sp. MAHUQ-68]|uniref:Lipoprotein n=1 Tax=Solitalea agri TaxID=2953739 RepID=A0A9X2JF99_9SPHI|nr:hypothetical protein [Solitalea agri]
MKLLQKPFIIYLNLPLLMLTGCYSLVKLSDHDVTTNDPKAFKNISKFSIALTSQIDTNAIYKECCSLFTLESSLFGFAKVSKHEFYNRTDGYVNYYRFYGNGHCNSFMLKANQKNLNRHDFDPTRTGHRGVYYIDKKGNVKVDLFTQIGELSSLRSSFGIRTETLTFNGDTIFLNRGDDNYSSVYIKMKVQDEIQQIKGW